jgi:DNA gyrase subunit A
MVSRLGYAKALAVRGSGGMTGAEAMAERDGDFVRQAFVARGSTEILMFTALGSVHSVVTKDFPRGTRSSRGKLLSDLVELPQDDRIVSLVPVADFEEEKYLLFVTRGGQVKRTAISEYANVRGGGIRAIGLADDDEVMVVRPSQGSDDVLLATRDGLAIRFSEDEIRVMGRTARGVKGIDIGAGDRLVAALTPRRDAELLVVSGEGYAKRVPFTEMKRQGRAGKGMAIHPDTDRAGGLVGVLAVHPGDSGMCELASGEVVPLAVDGLPVKPRRGAAVKIEALASRAGPVVAVHPLRVSVEDASDRTSQVDSEAAPEESPVDGTADLAQEDDEGAGEETQAELEF